MKYHLKKEFIMSCFKNIFAICLVLLALNTQAANPKVVMVTSQGEIELELFKDKAPKSVENFLNYVKKGFYKGTIFHRVINGFMVQGGGFTKDMVQKPTEKPIQNEATNKLANEEGTIAMARTMDPHSATAQFFINVNNNEFLNNRDTTPQGYGYAVFGKVTKGMSVVNKIKMIQTGQKNGMDDVPNTTVEILDVKVL